MRAQLLLSAGLLLPGVTGILKADEFSRTLFDVPKTASMRLSETYLRTDFEMEDQIQEAGFPKVTVSRQRILLQPVVGMGLAGWVYHQNLLEYVAQTELGWSWLESQEDPGEQGTDSHFLQRYHVMVDFLKQKPYYLAVNADKDMFYRDYDFFSRVRVDSERFGARSGYAAGPVPFTVGYQHYKEFVEDPTRPSDLREDTITLNANNQRRSSRANTQVSYNFDDYTRTDNGFGEQTGLSQNLNLFDSELFGEGDWIQLSSLLNWSSITKTVAPTDKLLIQEALRLQHTDRLASFYEYSFNRNGSGDSDSRNHQGRIGLNHQLYDNLSSTFDLHANSAESSSPGSTLETLRFGGGLNEQYTRPINAWGNIALGYTGGIDREDRNASGAVQSIIDEVHTLSDANLTFLNQPFVIPSTIVVTDGTGTILYIRDLDYSVIPQGPLTELRRIPGGRIPNGGLVLVDYSAALDPSSDYTSYANGLNFRFSVLNGLFSVYGHWTKQDYSGGELLNLRWFDDKLIGADSTWRWLRTGGEYEVMDSNQAPFDRVRLFQSISLTLSDSASLGFDADQYWTVYRDDNTKHTSFGFIARYQQRITARLAWTVEGGVRIERGQTFDRNYGTVRTGIDWTRGKLTVTAGYEFGSESHPTDLNRRHYGFLRLRRCF